MKKLRNLVAVLAMMSMAAVLTGCGDDDDDDDDDGGPLVPVIVAPADEAALTAADKVYTANVAGQNDPITLTFPSDGNYQVVQGGVTETGTYSGATRADNTWTMSIVPAAGQGEAQEGVLRLDFSGANAGTWTFTPTGGQAESGTFTLTTTNPDPDPDPDPDPNPTALTGKTLQINYPNGGGEKFQFTTDTALSYENGAQTGTYTWDQTNRRVNVTLNNGWLYEITIPAGGDSATVFFRENTGDPGTTDPATYTLQ
jgi:hypothetical protein